MSCSPLAPCSSVALSGPLPHSSLLHLALHHLHEEPATASQTTEGGQAVPTRQQLDTARERRVLILTSDQALLRDQLADERDVSLVGTRRNTDQAGLLDRIEIKHLPTSAHLTYFLTTVYTHSSPASARKAFVETGAKVSVDPSYLPFPPTLVVLHNASEYLAEDSAQRAGLEAFGSVLALFSSTFAYLTPSSPPLLVLHDRAALSLSTPVIPPHLSRPHKRRRKGASSSDDADEPAGPPPEADKLGLEEVVAYFFDWIGHVERIPTSPTSVLGEAQKTFVLTLSPSKRRLPPSVDLVQAEYSVTQLEALDAAAEEEGVQIELVG
ncbi:hypothetical protein BCR35DRAFT_351662 [Leucosporidium creatinivorum]|uniref:Uncharacterized protein n=1 Tax=Leucosporidium creatinivorum TaxID=106004 RepID=A0A1Y2FRJ8_9BASI|nr:hypothetical protein BCR35DRAFT_351662 [Leucosporidium creatinivorum]